MGCWIRGRTLVALVLFAGLVAASAWAQPLPRGEVPEPLEPWVDWVLRGHEGERCPFLQGAQVRGEIRGCVWPSRLELDLDERSGHFTQHWLVYDEVLVPLPGDAKRWPQDVRAEGRPIPVVDRGGVPSVRLAEGSHELTGTLEWDTLPELLVIPPQTGIVTLRLRGRTVDFPNRDARGRLWLQKRALPDDAAESRVEVDVHRRVADEVPLLLSTRIQLDVSGPSREMVLGRALPDGFLPMSLSSPLPARLDPDGHLRVQARAGTWHLQLEARGEGPKTELTLPDPAGEWDSSEVWVFDARPHLRVVVVEDGVPVDPAQTSLPPEWKHLPAYLMEPGRALRLSEKRRGDEDPAPDALHLARTWWLDFDGGGYTVSDRIEGVIHRSTRLEMGPTTRLGRVALGGRDQLITRMEGASSAGVEVPQGAINLAADSRVESGGRRLSAVGWDHDFQALRGVLHLPPGWRLLHASGVDRATRTWLNRWTLLDLFLALVIGIAFLRLWGPAWGGVALLTLALTYTEGGAPRWAWVAVLVGEALRRVLPAGRLAIAARVYQGLALALLVVVAVPFMVDQARRGMYPALEKRWPYEEFRVYAEAPQMGVAGEMLDEEEAAPPPGARVAIQEATPQTTMAPPPQKQVAKRSSAPLEYAGARRRYGYAPDPAARITTGPGLPAWQWEHVTLEWSGPVQRSQELRLVLVPPSLSRLLAFARVGLTVALVLCVLGATLGAAGGWLRRGGGGAVALALLVLAAPARADIPSQELLDELRQRLLANPVCHPECASSPRMRLEVEPGALRARIEIHADAETGVPLPGGARNWVPETVLVDGKPAKGLLRSEDGVLFLRLPTGRHQIVVEGALPERDSVELPLPLLPRRVEASARGWRVHGIHEDGLAEANLQLTRIRDEGERSPPALAPGELPPFVRVERALRLDLAWQVTTEVERVTPADTALVLAIPLLEGESVTAADVHVKDGHALVTMAPGATRVRWRSVLEERESLLLRAPKGVSWTEIWRLDVSPIWHVEAEGIPYVHQPSAEGARVREWRPWPGEELALRVHRPEGVEGSTVTIDASALEVRPGLRATDATLSLTLRSSRGGQHAIALPEGAELQSVSVDGAVHPIRQEGREVRIPLAPGVRRVEVIWREPEGIAGRFRFATPQVDLGIPSVNSEVRIAGSAGRWILFAGGPRLGPAVLFWPLVAVLALAALGLGRIRLTPLRFRHWLLLGLGLTQVPIWAAALVAAWLLALGWRKESGTRVPGRWFDLLQIGLAAVTVAALVALFFSIEKGLLGLPEMQIAGNGSSSELLRWYRDRIGAELPRPWILTVPLLVYRIAMLAWALWLAQAMVGWLRWGWRCFSQGELWRPLRSRPAVAGS